MTPQEDDLITLKLQRADRMRISLFFTRRGERERAALAIVSYQDKVVGVTLPRADWRFIANHLNTGHDEGDIELRHHIMRMCPLKLRPAPLDDRVCPHCGGEIEP